MLLFEFVGELFQFEAREPEFDVLSQLPPKMTASLSCLPFALLLHNPLAHDLANLGKQHLGCFALVGRHGAHGLFGQKPHPKPQLGQSASAAYSREI